MAQDGLVVLLDEGTNLLVLLHGCAHTISTHHGQRILLWACRIPVSQNSGMPWTLFFSSSLTDSFLSASFCVTCQHQGEFCCTKITHGKFRVLVCVALLVGRLVLSLNRGDL